jgi:hypothetical protein
VSSLDGFGEFGAYEIYVGFYRGCPLVDVQINRPNRENMQFMMVVAAHLMRP